MNLKRGWHFESRGRKATGSKIDMRQRTNSQSSNSLEVTSIFLGCRLLLARQLNQDEWTEQTHNLLISQKECRSTLSHHLWNETSHLLILIYWAWILAIRRDTQDIQWNLTTWADAANVCNERMKHRFRPSSLQLGGRKLCLRNGSHGSPQWWTMPRRQWRNAIRWDSVLKALSTTEAENILGKWNGSICGQKRHKRNSLKLNSVSGCCERMQRTDATSWKAFSDYLGRWLGLSGARTMNFDWFHSCYQRLR